MIDLTERKLTRVDTRRAYQLGAISKEDVKSELTALGYTGDRLDAMLRYYEETQLEEPKKLSKAAIIKGLMKKVITEKEAVSLLMDLNYSEYSAKFIIASELSASSPESYMEFKELTQSYRKAVGLPTKPITKEMKELEHQIHETEKEIEKLKAEKHAPALITDKVRLLTKLKQTSEQLQK
jgi:hypothetical protein